jgi:hypothetical protein
MSLTTYFNAAVQTLEAAGVNCDVTYQELSLGAADVRGQYIEYYADSTVKAVMEGPNGSTSVVGSGSHNQVTIRCITNTAVVDGGKIVDSFGATWKIQKAYPVTFGDVTVYYTMVLSKILSLVSGGREGVAPGHAIGVVTPLEANILGLPRATIEHPVTASILGLPRATIEHPVTASISTVVSITLS